jgi:HK97 family phage major capsid protein
VNLRRKPSIIGYRKNGAPIWLAQGGAPDNTELLDKALAGKDAADLKDGGLPDELRGKTPDELVQYIDVLDAHLRSIHQDEDTGELREKSPEEQKAFDYGLKLRDIASKRIEEHRAVQEIFGRKPKSVKRALANIKYGNDDPYGDVRRLTNAEARDLALRRLDDRNSTMHLDDAEKTQVEKQLRSSGDIARRILVTENEHYREAWMKLVTQPHPFLDDDERKAVQAWEEYRAMADFTSASGGYGIPVFIDPSIILTAQGSGNPFLSIARQVTVNTNRWKGVSSAGVSWAFQTEAAAATDNSPTLAQPAVDVHMARGFIPYSIEVGMDYPSFASEMSTLLAAGYDELLIDKFTRGSGSGEPFGILTVLSANAATRVRVATAGAINSQDPYNVWKALGQRFRRNSSWLMSVGVNSGIRQLGAANVFHGYTVNLPAEWADQLMGSAVYESPYMPDTTTTTSSTVGVAIVGDFSNFVIARNGGMSVELVPQLFQQVTAGTGPAVPTGQRGWFAYSRIGSNSVNDLAFRLLTNT